MIEFTDPKTVMEFTSDKKTTYKLVNNGVTPTIQFFKNEEVDKAVIATAKQTSEVLGKTSDVTANAADTMATVSTALAADQSGATMKFS
jgi:hypothetical protein